MKKILVCSVMLMALLFGNMATAATKVLFEDDFNDNVLDTSKWNLGVSTGGAGAPEGSIGNTVTEANGVLRVAQDSTDWGGLVYTKPIPVNPKGNITIRKRIRVHYDNQYYSGENWLTDVENDKRITHVTYRNYVYTYTAIGFGGAMPLLIPIWDEWVDELWEYDPKTGVTTYTLNNNETQTYTVETLKGSTVSYCLSSYGWWTGHYIETDYIIIEQEQTTDPCPECISVPLTVSNWNQKDCGTPEETPEGLKLYSEYFPSWDNGSGMMSNSQYDFRNSVSFVKWKVNAGNDFSLLYIGIQSFYIIHGVSVTTSYSYNGSEVVSDNVWYYSRYVINSDGTYSVITSTGDYDINGGTVFQTYNDTMTTSRFEFIDSAKFSFGLIWNQVDSAVLTIGEIKTTAKPVSISGSGIKMYNFESDTNLPVEFVHTGTYKIDTAKGYNSSRSIHSDSSDMTTISLDVTNALSVSFRIQLDGNEHNSVPAMSFNINDVGVLGQGKSFGTENCWTEYTIPIPNQTKSTLTWFMYRAGKIWIDDIKIIYDEVTCTENDAGFIDFPTACVKPGFPVTIPLRMQNAPNNVEAMGFDIIIPDGLTYKNFEKGSLVPAGYVLDVNLISANTLRCGAYKISGTDVIAAGASGEIVKLTFDVADTFTSPQKISLSALKDDIASWSATPGCVTINCCDGDINKDGQITPADALNAFQKYMQVCPTSAGLECDSFCADVNRDGSTTPGDALCIFHKYMNIPGCLD